jgi:hypothetical protein
MPYWLCLPHPARPPARPPACLRQVEVEQPECRDKNDLCPQWAASGECGSFIPCVFHSHAAPGLWKPCRLLPLSLPLPLTPRLPPPHFPLLLQASVKRTLTTWLALSHARAQQCPVNA